MGFKKEWRTLKKGYAELQRKKREAQAMAEAKRLRQLKETRIRQEAQAWRHKKIMEEKKKIMKAKATIQKSRGQSGFVKAGNWFLGTGNKPVVRKPSVKKTAPKYIIQGGVAYPVAGTKRKRAPVKRKPKKQSYPNDDLISVYNNLVK